MGVRKRCPKSTGESVRSQREKYTCLELFLSLHIVFVFSVFCPTICSYGCHLITSQSLNLGGRRGTTDDVCNNTFPPFPVFRCPQGISKPHLRLFIDVIFPSSSVFLSFLLLSLPPAELSSPCPSILRCGHTI